jgi:hypothetical protein
VQGVLALTRVALAAPARSLAREPPTCLLALMLIAPAARAHVGGVLVLFALAAPARALVREPPCLLALMLIAPAQVPVQGVLMLMRFALAREPPPCSLALLLLLLLALMLKAPARGVLALTLRSKETEEVVLLGE